VRDDSEEFPMQWWVRAKEPIKNIGEQMRGHAIALVSLLLALTSVSYGTWRDERTEHNRNVRAATFELLSKLADLERIVFLAHYDRDRANGNPRIGWTDVIVIHDLASVAPAPLESKAAQLTDVWRNNWEHLDSDDETSVEHIEDAVEDLRLATLATLRSLR
jgi:hypothetical protein